MAGRRLLLSPKLRPWRTALARVFDGEIAPAWMPPGLTGSQHILCSADPWDIGWATSVSASTRLPVTILGPGPIVSIGTDAEAAPLSFWFCEVAAGAALPGDPHRAAIAAALRTADTGRGAAARTRWNDAGLFSTNHICPRGGDSEPADGDRAGVIFDRRALADNPGLAGVAATLEPEAKIVVASLDIDIGVSLPADERATILDEPIAGSDLLAMCDRFYVHDSPFGLNALLAEKAVVCGGRPFYAGWGLTEDIEAKTEPEQAPSLDAFADAALVQTVLYRDPYDGKRIGYDEAIDIYRFLRDRYHENDRRAYCVGVKWWNHKGVAALLKGCGGDATFTDDFAAALGSAQATNGRVIAWSASATEERERACKEAGIPFARMEDGFLRSVGLGAALARGASAAFDTTGIYFDATRPSDLETMLETAEVSAAEIARAKALREAIVAARLTKYNVGKRGGATIFPTDKLGILVPGQVADDAGILKTLSRTVDCSGRTNVNESLLSAVRARNPDAFIVYKPHPDVEADLRKGRVPEEVALRHADAVVRDIDILDLIDQCDRIETVSSLAGFEALLRGKDVTVHGMPFYAGWGLTTDLTQCPRRGRKRGIDELVYFALIAYGRYIDPETLLHCPPERVIDNLARLRADRKHGAKYAVIKFASWLGRKLGL